MVFNSAISLLSGLKDLKDSGRDSALAIIAVGHSDFIKIIKWWFLVVFLNNFNNTPGLHPFKLAKGPL